MSTIGPGSNIERLLDEYGLGANSLLADVFESDTDRLLLALLLEERDQDIVDAIDTASNDYNSKNRSVYWSNNFTVDSDGPPDKLTDSQGRIDFGFESSSLDLRFTDEIQVRFTKQGSDNSTIIYRQSDEFAADIPVDTQYIYIERGPNATTDPTVYVEAWP